MVVVDRLSKYGHLISLSHPYTGATIAEAFIRDIVRLHGMPWTIVSDPDPIFLSNFGSLIFLYKIYNCVVALRITHKRKLLIEPWSVISDVLLE